MAMYPNMMNSIPFKKQHKSKFQAGTQEKQANPNEKGEEKENEQKVEENNNSAPQLPAQQEQKVEEQAN